MAEEAMCLPFMIDQAERVCAELNVPWNDLRDVHRHIINAEKLASMGQMAAGVAHELNNPLSTILLYSHILKKKLAQRDDLDHDLRLVVEESERCKKIVGNLLDFARQSRVHIESGRRRGPRAHGRRRRRRHDGARTTATRCTSSSTSSPACRPTSTATRSPRSWSTWSRTAPRPWRGARAWCA